MRTSEPGCEIRCGNVDVAVTTGKLLDRTAFTWDGTTLIEQTSTAGVMRWTYQPGSHTPLTQTALTGDQDSVDREFYAIITDLVGTPTDLIDITSTAVAGRASTSLWGLTSWSSGASTPIRFPGQYHDEETGLHYNLHRYYNPHTARYITGDPLGLSPSPNPNTYPHNPIQWSDPLGLMPDPCKNTGLTPTKERITPWGVEHEFVYPRPMKPEDAIDRWNEFLGPGEHTNINPKTGLPDNDRIVSEDGLRSIRFGNHEMNGKPTAFHFHEETWHYDDNTGKWHVDNFQQRVPLPKGTW